MSTKKNNLDELLKAMFGGEEKSNTEEKKSETKVKTLLTDEQLEAFSEVSKAIAHLADILMGGHDIHRLLEADKNDFNMFQYVVFCDLVIELIKTTEAGKDLLNFSEEDITEMCERHDCSVSETVVKVMIADIISRM